MMPSRVSLLVIGVVLAIGLYPPAAEATKVKDFVDYLDVKCDDGKVLESTTASDSDDCYQLCADKKKCKAAQFNKDLDKKCVLFKKCKKWEAVKDWGFAGRVSKKNGYYKAPKGFYCYNCQQVGQITASSSLGKCIKRCDNTKDCKQVEWSSERKDCTLWNAGLTMVATSSDYVTAKKKERTD